MKKSFLTVPIVIGQLAVVALFMQGCTTYTPGRTALGGSSTELPSGTVVKLDDQSKKLPVTTVTPRVVPVAQTQDPPFTKFVIPEGKPVKVPGDGLKKTAARHVPAPAPSVEGSTLPATVPSGGKYALYVVKRGDTAGEIANRHGLTRAEFTRINNLANPDRILVGQKLKVPSEGRPLPAGPASSASSKEEGVHIIASGETLSEIAMKYSMRTADLVALNGIADPNVVRVGQKLKVSKSAPRIGTADKKTTVPDDQTPSVPEKKPAQDKSEEKASSDAPEAADPMNTLLGSSSTSVTTPEADITKTVQSTAAPSVPKETVIKEHTVRESEDIFSIAIDYGVRPMEIRRENNMTGSALTPGSVIKIPSSDLNN